MSFCVSRALPLSLVLLASAAGAQDAVPRVDHVVHVSVDGLRPDAVTALGADRAPNFFRFRTQGTWTDNARADRDLTLTLPNHTTQLTGRHAFGDDGHGWWWNADPGPATLHGDGYLASSFDVAHDHGLSTALYTGKDKFVLFENSYDADSGAPDRTGADDGTDKIDTYRYDGDMAALSAAFVADLRDRQYGYAFFHFRHPDGVGHDEEWQVDPATAYAQKVEEIDALLGDLFAVVETTAGLAGRTAIVLTADHGGALGTTNHWNAADADNYTVPFYVWGPGVAMGADLYALNADARLDPGTRRPRRDEAVPPVRNGDAANLALAFLGLPAVPGSTIGADQELRVAPAPGLTVRVFQQGLAGYAGTVDTFVRQDQSGASYGASPTLLVDGADPWWSGRDNQALVRFDGVVGPDQVPAGAQVERAVLSLRVVNAGDGGAVHRMLRPWSDAVTWDGLGRGVQADGRQAAATASAVVSDADEGALTVDVTADVQAWAGGAPNHGWALLPGGNDGWDVYSAEGYMPPRLAVAYSYAAFAADPFAAARAEALPEAVELQGGLPNPFRDATTVRFALPEAGPVRLEVFDVQGRRVAVLADGTRAAGPHEASFDAGGLPAGLYLVRLAAGGAVLNARVTLVR